MMTLLLAVVMGLLPGLGIAWWGEFRSPPAERRRAEPRPRGAGSGNRSVSAYGDGRSDPGGASGRRRATPDPDRGAPRRRLSPGRRAAGIGAPGAGAGAHRDAAVAARRGGRRGGGRGGPTRLGVGRGGIRRLTCRRSPDPCRHSEDSGGGAVVGQSLVVR